MVDFIPFALLYRHRMRPWDRWRVIWDMATNHRIFDDGFYLSIITGPGNTLQLTRLGTATKYTVLELSDTSGWAGAHYYNSNQQSVPLTVSFEQVDEPVSAALLAQSVLALVLLAGSRAFIPGDPVRCRRRLASSRRGA